MVKLERLLLDADLLGLLNYCADGFLYLFWIRCTEEDILHFLFERSDVLLHNFSEGLEVALFIEENIRLINDKASQF